MNDWSGDPSAWGATTDVEGECNAHCYIGDNYGDGSATMRCQLPKGHAGHHRQEFRLGTCVLTWMNDERCYHEHGSYVEEPTGDTVCSKCGETLAQAVR